MTKISNFISCEKFPKTTGEKGFLGTYCDKIYNSTDLLTGQERARHHSWTGVISEAKNQILNMKNTTVITTMSKTRAKKLEKKVVTFSRKAFAHFVKVFF